MVLKVSRRTSNRDMEWINLDDIYIGDDVELPISVEAKDVFINILDVLDDSVLIGLSDYYAVDSTDMDMDYMIRSGKYIDDGGCPLFITLPLLAGREVVLKSHTLGQVEFIKITNLQF